MRPLFKHLPKEVVFDLYRFLLCRNQQIRVRRVHILPLNSCMLPSRWLGFGLLTHKFVLRRSITLLSREIVNG
jgi:hypothetical protein